MFKDTWDNFGLCLIVTCIVLQIMRYDGNVGAVLGWVVALSSQLVAMNLKHKLNNK